MAAVTERSPLYLERGAQLSVFLEGPALRVCECDKADRLYPIRRLERVSTTLNTRWNTDALLACAMAGVSVQFVDADGTAVARMVGTGGCGTPLHTRVAQLVGVPRWRAKYRQWCWAQRLQTLRYVGLKLGFEFQEARELEMLVPWCEQRALQRVEQRAAARALQWLREDFYGLVTQVLQARGIWQQDELGLKDPMDLAADISHILQSTLLLVRDRCLDDQTLDRRMVAGWFVSEHGFLRFQVERMIQRFDAWVAEFS